MKYKCIKSYCSGTWLTKGNIYEETDGNFTYDDGFVSWNWNFKESNFGNKNECMNYYLEEIKEDKNMKREFKVGDIIKGVKGSGRYTFTNGYMTKGEVVEVKCGLRNSEIKVKIIEHTKTPSRVGMIYTVSPEYFELIDNQSKTLTITTSDTLTTLTDGIHTTTVNRYHTDKHNERNAVSSVIDKYYDELNQIEIEKNMPKVGDMVRVVDKGEVYSTNYMWLEKNNAPLKTAIKWKYRNSDIGDGEYRVICIHKHNLVELEDRALALIEDEYDAFIINIEGLEVVR